MQAPQFKTWLYIYRNNSVNTEFRRTLNEDYFVDVKEIDRLELNEWSDEAPTSTVNIGGDANFVQPQADDPIADADNSKDVPEFDTLNLVQADETRTIEDGQNDASKFDEVVEDKQYVEVPVIREEIAQQLKDKENQEKDQTDKEHRDSNIIAQDIAEKPIMEKVALKETARLRVPVRGFDNFEIMEAQESHFDAREVFALKSYI